MITMIGPVMKNLIVLAVTGFYSGFFPVAPGTMGTLAALATFYGACALFNLQPSQGELFFLATGTLIIGIITVSTYLRTHELKESKEAYDSYTQESELVTSQGALASRAQKTHLDPKEIVIDEWAGIFTALAFAPPPTFTSTFVIFGLFRFFDASKIGPVGLSERLPGALGVMADDIVAGALAGIAFQLIAYYVAS
jgi:phosphatidylglycerophosphatase A